MYVGISNIGKIAGMKIILNMLRGKRSISSGSYSTYNMV